MMGESFNNKLGRMRTYFGIASNKELEITIDENYRNNLYQDLT